MFHIYKVGLFHARLKLPLSFLTIIQKMKFGVWSHDVRQAHRSNDPPDVPDIQVRKVGLSLTVSSLK